MSNWESTQALLASAAQTASGTGAAVDLGTRDRLLRQTLSLTAFTGTPSLTVRLEASPDGTSAWKLFGAFTPASSVSSEKLSFVSPERFVRIGWTMSGTSITFDVAGSRGICFANLEQLDGLGLPSAAVSNVLASKKVEALAATTEMASGILSTRYVLPLLKWGIDLTQACCKITAYDLLSVRGFNPDGDDKNVRDRYDDAMKWLMDVARGAITPVGLEASPPEDDEDGGDTAESFIVTHEPRAWR